MCFQKSSLDKVYIEIFLILLILVSPCLPRLLCIVVYMPLEEYISRSVVFDESKFPFLDLFSQSSSTSPSPSWFPLFPFQPFLPLVKQTPYSLAVLDPLLFYPFCQPHPPLPFSSISPHIPLIPVSFASTPISSFSSSFLSSPYKAHENLGKNYL